MSRYCTEEEVVEYESQAKYDAVKAEIDGDEMRGNNGNNV